MSRRYYRNNRNRRYYNRPYRSYHRHSNGGSRNGAGIAFAILVLLLLEPKVGILILIAALIIRAAKSSAKKSEKELEKRDVFTSDPFPAYSEYQLGSEPNNQTAYYGTEYYRQTQLPLNVVMNDNGRLGEYLAYQEIMEFEKTYQMRFVFNAYLPTANGKTTEADIICVCMNGIFVIECKNYSGYIFGNDKNKCWIQTLNAHTKTRFYNPIWQNSTHISNLLRVLGREIPTWSLIVFSEKSELKDITVNRKDTYVLHQRQLHFLVQDIMQNSKVVLGQSDVEEIYNRLFPFTQVDQSIKDQHIRDIESYINEEKT